MERLRSWLQNGLPREAQVGLLVALVLPLLPLALMLAYNLAAPLFRSPSMTYGEATGLLLLAGMLVGVVALLKE